MSDLEARALTFAARAHDGQKRKYTGAPYITHPQAVAETVRSVPHTEEMIAAALLHDVVEDCGVPIATIKEEFGESVCDLVNWLTGPPPGGLSRAERKGKDLIRLGLAPAEAQTIKLADLIDNGRSIAKHDTDFARVYLEEKRALLSVLTKGSVALRHEAETVLLLGQAALIDADFVKRVRAVLHLVEGRIAKRANPARMGIENLAEIRGVLLEVLVREGVEP